MIRKETITFKDNDIDVDDRDGFGPIRTGAPPTSSNSPQQVENDRGLLRMCIEFLTRGPRLQSPSMDATRDKELTQLILDCANTEPEKFLLVCPILLNEIRHGMLSFSLKDIDNFMNSIQDLLQNYAFSRSECMQSLVIQLLDSTLATWTLPSVASSEVGGRVRELCEWLSGLLGSEEKPPFVAWTIRDQLAQFLDRYLVRDPTQASWSIEKSCEPIALLPRMSKDDDIRVRFRIAVINARLFTVAPHLGVTPLDLYGTMKRYYTLDLDK
jgi:ataxia telangiectasia mutated family protein